MRTRDSLGGLGSWVQGGCGWEAVRIRGFGKALASGGSVVTSAPAKPRSSIGPPTTRSAPDTPGTASHGTSGSAAPAGWDWVASGRQTVVLRTRLEARGRARDARPPAPPPGLAPEALCLPEDHGLS